MGTLQFSIAAATGVVGYDLLKDVLGNVKGNDRLLTGVALTGSAAAGDTLARLMIDTVEVGKFYNSATGYPTMDHVIPQDDNYIPANAMLHMYVEDAPTTNPIAGIITYEDV